MPTILSNKKQQGLLPGNPGEAEINPSQFGRAEDALSSLGKTAQNIGNQYTEMRTRSEEADAVLNQNITDARDLESKKNALKQEYMVEDASGVTRFDPRGKPSRDPISGDLTYPESYSKRIEQIAKEQYESGKAAMPSQRAQRSYQQVADGMVMREVNEGLNFEQNELTRYILQNKDKYETDTAINVRNSPSLDNLSSGVAMMSKYYNDNRDALFSPDKAAAEQKKSIKNIIKEGYFEGMLDKNPEQGLAVLNSIGKPQKDSGRSPAVNGQGLSVPVFGGGGNITEMSKYLDADEINNLRDRFNAKIKEKNMVEAHDIDYQLADIKAASFNGQDVGGIKKVSALIERQAQLGAFKTPDQKVRAYSDAISAVVVGQAKRDLAGMSGDEIAQAMPRYQELYSNGVKKVAAKEGVAIPKEFAASDSIEVKTKITAAVNETLKERATDPAKSIISGNDTIGKNYTLSGGGIGPDQSTNSAYINQSMNEQLRLGVTNPKPLTVADAKATASKIAGLDSARAAVEIDLLKNKTGDHFPVVMKQLISDGKLPEYFMTASYLDDPQASSSLLDSFKNKKTYKDILAQSNSGYKEKDVRNYVNQEFDDYFKAMTSNNLSPEEVKYASAIREAAYLQSANLVARGVDAETAAARSVDTVIRNKQDVYRGAIIPKQYAEATKAAMDSVADDAFARQYANKIYSPYSQGMQKQNPTHEDLFRAAVEKINRVGMGLKDPTSHTWITNSDGNGATMYWRVKEPGNPIGFKIVKAITDDKKPITVDFKTGKLKVGE